MEAEHSMSRGALINNYDGQMTFERPRAGVEIRVFGMSTRGKQRDLGLIVLWKSLAICITTRTSSSFGRAVPRGKPLHGDRLRTGTSGRVRVDSVLLPLKTLAENVCSLV